ncbi:MAG: hypothetical protein HFG60_09920 [Lachnospiraceae bacterium]|nr:hypothetical protein [Lachnospiraceae bacterium]
MLMLEDIRTYIAGLGVAGEDHVYIGKLDNKKLKSIGVYSRPENGQPYTAIGGMDCTTYDIKRVSLLIHWNKSKRETEKAAGDLFEKLKCKPGLSLGGTRIHYLRLMVPEPQDVGSDDNGVYEYVIWLDFIFERKRWEK